MAAKEKKKADSGYSQMVFFCLANEQFALDISRVREIVRLPSITKLPRTPDYVAGIVNLRGDILPVIDTRKRMSLDQIEADDRTRILVTEIGGHSTGLLVDAVLTVNEVSYDAFQPPPPAVQNIDSKFLSGVIKNGSDKLSLVLDIDEVVSVQMEQQEGRRNNCGGALNQEEHHEAVVEEVQLVTFTLNSEEYAFEVESVREIMRVGLMADVPNAPDYIKGLITVRDRVIPTFDLRSLLGMIAAESEDNERILIVEAGDFVLGMLVDRVSEVTRYPRHLVQIPPDTDDSSELKGIVKVDQGRNLIMILNQEKLLSDEENSSIRDLLDDETLEGVDMNEEMESAKESTEVTLDDVQLVTFNLGDEEYGIEITQVQEINRLGKITCMPKSPDFIEGVTNLRGEVIPVIDTRKRFGLPVRDNDDRTRIIIVDMAGRKTGLVADRVNEVMRLSRESISQPPTVIAAREEARFFSGIGKLENGSRMVLLLDVEKILSLEEQSELQHIPSEEGSEAKDKKPSRAKATAKSPKKTSAEKKSSGAKGAKNKKVTASKTKQKRGSLTIEE